MDVEADQRDPVWLGLVLTQILDASKVIAPDLLRLQNGKARA
jgi:hypothetical protein